MELKLVTPFFNVHIVLRMQGGAFPDRALFLLELLGLVTPGIENPHRVVGRCAEFY